MGREGAAGRRILVADDHATNRLKLAMAVRALGHSADQAENGRRALDMLRAAPFDLLLLDIQMPEMDGYAVLDAMKADPALRDIPVIVISAVEELSSAVACIERGAEDYLPKNFNPVLLRARIGASLEKKRLRDAVMDQMAFIREIFGRFVPDEVATALIGNHGVLAPVRREATILYTDIEGFTRIAEGRPPEATFSMLNAYFPAIVEPIVRNGGVVNQLHGDALVALFNLPTDCPDHADAALRAAIEIRGAARSLTFDGQRLRTRIGVNTGPVVAGAVGDSRALHYTALGDAVNVAARLEELNKEHGTDVLISGATGDRLQGAYALAELGRFTLRGRAEPLRVLRLLD